MSIQKSNIITVNPDGRLFFGKKIYKCALGKSGVSKNKREGDGATPVGTFPIREVFYRPDRVAKPKGQIPISKLKPNDAWSDDPKHDNYNKKVSMPHEGRIERLWRTDHAYDIIVVIGYNDEPVKTSSGSAIFIHIASDNYKKTRGCIALKCSDLEEIISKIPATCFITISPKN